MDGYIHYLPVFSLLCISLVMIIVVLKMILISGLLRHILRFSNDFRFST